MTDLFTEVRTEPRDLWPRRALISLTGTTTVLATLAVLLVATAWLSFRFKRLRPLLEGEPTLLISDGRILERNLRRERMTIEEIRAEARQKSIGSLDDIRFAVLETNGRISFITRDE